MGRAADSAYDLDLILNNLAGYDTVVCPRCDHPSKDLDGFGFVFCRACGYCTHPARTAGVCDICRDGPRGG